MLKRIQIPYKILILQHTNLQYKSETQI